MCTGLDRKLIWNAFIWINKCVCVCFILCVSQTVVFKCYQTIPGGFSDALALYTLYIQCTCIMYVKCCQKVSWASCFYIKAAYLSLKAITSVHYLRLLSALSTCPEASFVAAPTLHVPPGAQSGRAAATGSPAPHCSPHLLRSRVLFSSFIYLLMKAHLKQKNSIFHERRIYWKKRVLSSNHPSFH